MGLFLQTAIVPDCDEGTARTALQNLAEREDLSMNLDVSGCRFSSNDKGVQVLFNDWCTGYGHLAENLSKETGRAVLLLYIYDDDFWGYFFWENGIELDNFAPLPDYFGEEETIPDLSGNAALIASRFNIPEEVAARYLITWSLDDLEGEKRAFDDDEFCIGDCWQMADFMAKLGWNYPWD